MSEVLLLVNTPLDADEFARAMRLRRWEAVTGMEGWFRCPFEHGFVDELTTLVRGDVGSAVGTRAYRAAFVHTSEPAHICQVSAAATSTREGPWRDREANMPEDALLADVILGVAEKMTMPLTRRGWRAVEGTQALTHAFDLRMFEPVAERVEADLAGAAHELGLAEARGLWAMSTRRVVCVASPKAPPARRPLPWD